MKFLHTGDLHLGKMFYELSLLPDQENMLEQLYNTLHTAKESPYDALVIAGDVYDRAVPSPEAVSLFDDFLTRLRQNFPQLKIIIIPGNHDSARRLAFASHMLAFQGIYIYSAPEDLEKPIVFPDAVLYGLPFLTPGFFSPEETAQVDMVQTALDTILHHYRQHHTDKELLLCAHLFAAGGEESESERSFVGTAQQVPVALFKDFRYVALGHLHRCQQVAANMWYSGSPLAYSFSEADAAKYVLDVTILPKANPTVTKIPIQPVHPVVRRCGSFEDFFRDTCNAFADCRNAFLEISCTDTCLIENPMNQLKSRYPYLLSFRQDEALRREGLSTINERRDLLQKSKSNLPSEEIFEAFIRDIYSTLPENFEAEKALFVQTMTDLQREMQE